MEWFNTFAYVQVHRCDYWYRTRTDDSVEFGTRSYDLVVCKFKSARRILGHVRFVCAIEGFVDLQRYPARFFSPRDPADRGTVKRQQKSSNMQRLRYVVSSTRTHAGQLLRSRGLTTSVRSAPCRTDSRNRRLHVMRMNARC